MPVLPKQTYTYESCTIMYMLVWKVYVYAWFASGYHACVYLFEGHVYACFAKAGKHML